MAMAMRLNMDSSCGLSDPFTVSEKGFCHHGVLPVIWLARLGAAFDVFDIGNPVFRAPPEARFLILFTERGRRMLQKRGVYAFERMDADHRVGVALDLAGDDRHDATVGADMKLRRLCAKTVLGHERCAADGDFERARVARRPYAPMLGAKRAIAGAGRDCQWFRFPGELERDVPAVTASVDQHDDGWR